MALPMGNTDRVWVLLAKKKAGEASAAELLELDGLMEQQGLRGHASEVIDKVWEAPLVANPELRPEARVWEKVEKRMGQAETRTIGWRWAAAASMLVVVA